MNEQSGSSGGRFVLFYTDLAKQRFELVRRLTYLMLALMCAGSFSGCSGHARTVVPAHAAPSQLPLVSFPEVPRMRLGEYQAQIKPLISIPLVAPAEGELLFHATESRQWLDEGVLWGELDSEQLAAEQRALDLKIRQAQFHIEEELAKVREEVERVQFMVNDPALRELPYKAQIQVSSNLIAQLLRSQELLEDELKACGASEQLAFDQKARNLILTMPFPGELLLYFPVSPQRQEFRVAANMPIGLIRDLSRIYLHLIVRDPQTVAIPPDQLSVELKEIPAKAYHATFYDQQVLQVQYQDVLVYRFAFPPEEIAELAHLIGANITCELWAESPTPFHLVPKIELARMLEGQEAITDWAEGVRRVWPGTALQFSGRSDLGIAASEQAP